jgi:glycosyltransferase involved in cell wall biosynthesis
MPPNAKFLQITFGVDNVKVASPASSAELTLRAKNSVVESNHFYKAPLPAGCSTKEFYKRAIFQPGFYRKFCVYCDKIIDDNPESIFWARTPSPGSVIFAHRVIKANRKLLHHICGDARDTWRDKKYSGFNKVLAYLFSKIVILQLYKIIKYENSVNLTSGSRLYDFSSALSNRTYQFLDVVSNGVECVNLKKNQSEILNVVFVGRIVDDKGVFELLSAFKKAVDKLGSVYHLTVVGDGPDLLKLKEVISNYGLLSSVKLTGVLDASGVSEVLRQADIVAIPSKTNEGFPRVIFEAWSHCVPVIVSQIGGISTFVVNNQNAQIVSPGSVSEIFMALLKCKDSVFYAKLKKGAQNSKIKSTQKYWSEVLINIVQKEFACEK